MLWDSHLLSFELWLGLKRFSTWQKELGKLRKYTVIQIGPTLWQKKTNSASVAGNPNTVTIWAPIWTHAFLKRLSEKMSKNSDHPLFSHGICLTNDFAHKTSNVFSCFVTKLRDMWGCWAWKLSVRNRGYLGNVRAEYNNTLVGVASALNLGLSLVGSPPCQPYLAVLLSSECSMLSLSQLDL